MKDRLRGYQKAIQEAGAVSKVLKLPYNLPQTEISKRVKLFLQKNKQLNGVLFATNYLALGGIDAIKKLGMKVPENLAVIGFDDDPTFELLQPTITAVAQPVQQISEEVIRLLMKNLAVEKRAGLKKETVVLKTKLMIRQSSLNFDTKNKFKKVG